MIYDIIFSNRPNQKKLIQNKKNKKYYFLILVQHLIFL